MPVERVEVDAILFDMDGTLIDSTPAVNATWREFAKEYNLDIDHVLRYSHGHRTVENLTRYIPTLRGEELDKEVVRFESRILVIAEENRRRAQETGVDDGTIIAMPCARELLAQINAGRDTHPERRNAWAIVTSATGAYAAKAYKAADVADPPDSFVTSDLCSKGKPDPEPYLKGAELINVKDMSRCIVVEDAPPGVLSGKRAGAKVIGLKTTHEGQRMWDNGADWLVEDLSKVSASWEDGKLVLTIDTEERPTTK
ncbi:hypothetical protein MCUN1_001089 [Malassezia cuniculi]|uniref:Uncharacterized protein n=1 Tax=Malassezia cuniculi TaxID=948313 RepID=A0AAF0EWX0_9BASI|nr:hypothetical protein MCUN1_001089 [Malassezia cuniculi]